MSSLQCATLSTSQSNQLIYELWSRGKIQVFTELLETRETAQYEGTGKWPLYFA